ncbi:MAG: asparagine synthase (glutamine-hydrolyzing) [Ruminococcaceae bacterium]|nr:asparagine synthase (glutamine-hydrolyzing) [Oscillospiraceae bacterium]
MCGFVGFTGYLENRQDVLRRMADRIIHRGPDMEGYHISSAEDSGNIALGFRRLSIIDLADGAQPMYNEDRSVVCVFNGEIYNFMDLRDELISKGHIFNTKCDTEVIVHGFEEYGDDIVTRLRGMFAFVIWDKRSGSLFGARDHFGIKPFYYSKISSGDIIFGSEIKSFLEHPGFSPEVNPDALRPYLTFQYSATEETFFKNTYKLLPGHCFTLKDGEMDIREYWDVDFSKKSDMSFDEAVSFVDDRVRESVAAHRISDVKVGSFLSGGVDSSYITAALMPNKTFSVGFDFDNFDETGEAKELSKLLGVENYTKMLTADDCFDALADIQYHMDEPQSNPSSVPLYFLAGLASEHVTVVLSGEGADEIYAGYEWYDENPMMRKYKKLPSFIRRGAAGISAKLPYFKGHDFIIKGSGKPENYFIGQALVFPEKEAAAILRPKYRSGMTPKDITAPIYDRVKDLSELEKKQYLDLKLWLPGDILLKADKMSMAHSIELRVPYLDREVMREAATIPEKYKITPENTKYVLRKAANRILPNEWADRTKKGFPVPIRKWLREDKYYNYAKEYFTSDAAAEFFDPEILLGLLEDHRSGKCNNGRKIWTALVFLVWHRRFFGN